MTKFYNLYKELKDKEGTKDKAYTIGMKSVLDTLLKVSENEFE